MRDRRGVGAAARASPRLKVFQPTEIEIANATTRAHMLNLSTGGALLHASDVPPAGSIVRVACAGRMMTAEVRWVHGRRFGVQFRFPLTAAEIGIAVDAGAGGGTAGAAERSSAGNPDHEARCSTN